MLDRNGSAVDAALAACICNGLINFQSMGFGGGFVMTIYKKDKNEAMVLNAKDTAPGAAHARMFDGTPKHASVAGMYLQIIHNRSVIQLFMVLFILYFFTSSTRLQFIFINGQVLYRQLFLNDNTPDVCIY